MAAIRIPILAGLLVELEKLTHPLSPSKTRDEVKEILYKTAYITNGAYHILVFFFPRAPPNGDENGIRRANGEQESISHILKQVEEIRLYYAPYALAQAGES
jgi:hypothetical protein